MLQSAHQLHQAVEVKRIILPAKPIQVQRTNIYTMFGSVKHNSLVSSPFGLVWMEGNGGKRKKRIWRDGIPLFG